MQTKDTDTEYNRNTLAKFLNLKPDTLANWEWRKKYDLKPVKRDTRVFYRKSVIEKWLGISIKNIHEPLLCRKEAARYINFAVGSISTYDYNKKYDLKPIKVGYIVRYQREELDRFKEQILNS